MRLDLIGVEFEFSILPLTAASDGYWANIRLAVNNEDIRLERAGEYLTREEVKRLISAIELLLKGKIFKKYALDPIEPGLEIDLIPNIALNVMTKEQREAADCGMEFKISTRNEKTRAWSNASVSVCLSRREIEMLVEQLKKEYNEVFERVQESPILPYLFVRGKAGNFCLTILGYEFGSPGVKADWDEDWLEIMVEFGEEGEKRVYTDPSLLTNELEEAILEMEGLLHIEKGEYRSNFLEPYFVLNAFKDGDKFEVEVKFFNDPESDDYNWKNTEIFAREICDKTEYVKKIYSLKAILEMFSSRNGTRKKKPFIGSGETFDQNGEYLYVGVSPKGHYGYNYWYIDEEKQTQPDTYVWVHMGRSNKEQLVYVDSIRYCNENTVPYPIEKTKRILRQATEEEMEEAEILWDEY